MDDGCEQQGRGQGGRVGRRWPQHGDNDDLNSSDFNQHHNDNSEDISREFSSHQNRSVNGSIGSGLPWQSSISSSSSSTTEPPPPPNGLLSMTPTAHQQQHQRHQQSNHPPEHVRQPVPRNYRVLKGTTTGSQSQTLDDQVDPASSSRQKQPQQQVKQQQHLQRQGEMQSRNGNNSNHLLPGAYRIPGISGSVVGDSSRVPTASGTTTTTTSAADADEGRGGGAGGGDKAFSYFTRKKRRILLVIGISICLIVIISLIVATVMSKIKDNSSTTRRGGESLKQHISILRTKIEQLSITNNVTSLYDIRSPQYKALLWLASSSSSSTTTTKRNEPFLEDERLQTRYALLVLYYSTNGPLHWYNQHNFLTPAMHECDWSTVAVDATSDTSTSSTGDMGHNGDDSNGVGVRNSTTAMERGSTFRGIGCDSSSLQVTSIKLGKCVDGILICVFPRIQAYLRAKYRTLLGGNNLVGTIPDEIGALTYLTSLNLKDNSLSGKVRNSLLKLKNLVELDLSENQLSSTLPNLLEIETLQTIQLSHNMFSGLLPLVGRNVMNLNVSNNLLEGTVLSLQTSRVSGGFAGHELELLDLSYNVFSGQINLNYDEHIFRNLKILKIDGNSLNGYLMVSCPIEETSSRNCGSPSSLWEEMPSLTIVSASKNQFTGPLSRYMGNLTLLKEINLSENLLTGPIPSTFGNLHNLKILKLHDNNLSGTIPESFTALSSLGKSCP